MVGGNSTQQGQEVAMEGHMLTREEVALSILNGIISALSSQSGYPGAIDILKQPSIYETDIRKNACAIAFQMADLFIQERDRV
jgi:hypothetical protein